MRKLYFVRGFDIDGASWEAHVSAVHSAEAVRLWWEDQNLTPEQVDSFYPDGVAVRQVLSSVPHEVSTVLGWRDAEVFGGE